MRLDHVNIAVPAHRLEAVRAFYCDVLGLTVGERPAFSRQGYWLYDRGGACVHLVESDRHPPPDRPAPLDHVAFRAEDLEGVRRRLDALGVEYQEKHIAEFGLVQLFMHDPAGVRVELGFAEGQR